jgi:hypothetical protein
VIVRGGDDHIYQNRFNRFDGTWSGWGEIPGGGSTPSAPAATVYNNGTLDVLEVAVRGGDNRIYHNQFSPLTRAWSGWGEIPGGGATPSGPDMTVYGTHLQVVVRGTDDGLWLNGFDGVSWTGWGPLTSLALTPDDPSVDVFDNTLWVYTRDVENRIFRTIPVSEVPTDLEGDTGLAASSDAAAASLAKITCFPKALQPVHALVTVEGSARTHCTAPMGALGVHVALWRAVPAQIGGRAGFWTLVDHDFDVTVAQANVLQVVSAPCNPNMVGRNAYVITALHTMTPPPGYKPQNRTTVTNSGPVQITC